MSFHGGLIGIMLGTYLFSKKLRVNSIFFLDIISCVAPIGIFFGRIANFINSELYGKPTSLFWSVIFPEVDKVPRHPSQLYEATLEGILLFVILISLIYKKSLKIGIVSALFMILYGLFRIISEQFREPDVQVGYLFNLFSMGTILSFFMILIGLFILRKAKNNEFAK
jgi:phosphatidylglycerol:prolipoprotein diacylglycerol transferase